MLFNGRSTSNSRSNVQKDSSRGESLGSKFYSYSGVRFFEPKFMDSLNTTMTGKTGQKQNRGATGMLNKMGFGSASAGSANKKSNCSVFGQTSNSKNISHSFFYNGNSNCNNSSSSVNRQVQLQRQQQQRNSDAMIDQNCQNNKENNDSFDCGKSSSTALSTKEKLKQKLNNATAKSSLSFQQQKDFQKQQQKQSKQEKNKKQKSQMYRISNVRGLHNIGNTCYMNSTLQCLLNLSRFNHYFIKQVAHRSLDVSAQYTTLVNQFTSQLDLSPFTPSKIKSAIGRKKSRFAGTGQQDAQQFLTAFLEFANEEMSRVTSKPKYVELDNDPTKKAIRQLSKQWWQYNKKRDDSVICDHFQGQLVSTVTCKKCTSQSVTFDNIWGLPLSLPKSASSISITELIKSNWNIESQIQDYYCSKCSKHRTCMKKLELFRLPQVMVIQLKRFEYGRFNKKQKIKTSVKLNQKLSLADAVNSYSEDRNASMYKLTSMVHHYGQVDFGHYTASAYKQNTKKWHLLNDSKTSENIPQNPSNTVYLLFYERITVNPSL